LNVGVLKRGISSCVVALVGGCSPPATIGPYASVISECTPMTICDLCRNAMAFIEADVASLGDASTWVYTQHDSGGGHAEQIGQVMTTIALSSIRTIKGTPWAGPSLLLIDGVVRADGMSRDGPLEDAQGSLRHMYFFTSDYFGQLPTYALGCGGQLWSDVVDGGVRVFSTHYGERSSLSQSELMTEVDADWGASSCP
jgi:hypothetical protein